MYLSHIYSVIFKYGLLVFDAFTRKSTQMTLNLVKIVQQWACYLKNNIV